MSEKYIIITIEHQIDADLASLISKEEKNLLEKYNDFYDLFQIINIEKGNHYLRYETAKSIPVEIEEIYTKCLFKRVSI